MREKSIPQRLLSLLLACVLCLTCAPTAFAESAVAASMRLMKTEGTVSVSNSSGRTVTQTERMSLRSGYQLETAEKSYAWINLDDVKLAEMDAVTEIGIRKKGKKLDILVESGSLLFKVDEPLEGDENLNIRTSTMAIGVRGTCGWVKVIDQWTSRIYILEGSVEASVSDPVSGEVKTETISAGEMAICTVYPQDRSGSKCDIVRQDFTVADIDGFVLVELTPDKTVCDKIYEESGLDLRDPSVKPAEKLKQDQEKVRDQLAEIDNRVQEQENNIAVDPVWTDPTADDKITVPATPNGGTGTGGGTGGGGNGGGSTPAPTETVTLVMPQTAAAVNQELARSTVRQVVLLPGTARASAVNHLEVDSALTVPAGKTLTLQNGVGLILLANQPLAVHGTLSVGDVCYLFGNLTAGSGAVIKAKGFSLDMPDHMAWERSAEPDANGFYFLTYIGKTFTVTFEANGGSVTPSSARTGSGGKLASLPTPVREGYTFAGWFTAAEGGTRVTTSTVFTDNAAIYAHWSESEDLDWRYDQPTKTLYITGTGPMEAYPSENHVTQAPWSMYAAEMRAVVIDSGVESVGHRAFEGCSNLQSVVLPSSVTSIGDSAFAYCTSLNSIALPNGLRSIAPYAFFQCTELRDVQIPRSTTAIGQAAFGQSGLTSVTVPGSVMGLDNMTFISCYNLTTATLEQGVATVAEQVFNNCSSLQTLYLPASLSSIGDESFIGNPALSDVYFDGTEAEWSGVSVLGNNASLLNAAFHFKDDGEEGWRYDETTKTLYILGSGPMVDYPTSINRPWYQYREEIQSVVIENGITSIGDSAFCECGSLTSVTIPNSVTSIGDVAFYECGSLTRVTIPDSVTSIGETAFWKCTALTSVTIPNRVATIGGRAFMECSSLTSITIPDSVTSIGFAAFSNCGSLASVTLPNGIASISESAFADCHSLTSVTIPDSVTLIGSGAFARCDGLTSVTIPASVTGIGDYAFDGCAKLTDVYYGGTAAQWETVEIGIRNDPLRSANIHFNGGEDEWRYDEATKTLYITGSGPMKNYGDPNDRPWSQYTEEIQSVIIENGITSIGSTAFYFCTSLTSATIPDSVTSVEQYAFRGDASLKDVYYGGDEAQWEAITLGNGNDPLRNATIHFSGEEEGVTWRYDEATKTLYITGSGPMEGYLNSNDRPWNQYASEIQSVVIENGITSVGSRAFSQCSSLTSVTIPNSVTSIDIHAFSGCSGLISVTIPDGVTRIDNAAFYECSGLTSVTIPDSVTSIGSSAFYECSGLASVTIPSSVTTINNWVFGYCSSLTSVTIPDSVTSIGDYVFSECSGLTSVTIPASVTTIGVNAFSNCSKLADVYYGGTEAQWNAIPYITDTGIPDTATIHFQSDGDVEEGEGYRYNTATKTLYITGSGPMDDYASPADRPWNQYASEIQSVVIENGITSVGDRAFSNCSSLTSVTIPNSVTSINNSAFSGCSGLTSVTIPNSVTSIGQNAFFLSGLTSVNIPDSVATIGSRAFGSSRLTSVIIPDSVTSIGEIAFSECSNLTSVKISNNVTSIEAGAFSTCRKLTSVAIPNGVTSIGQNAFNNCSGLTSVTIPSSVTTIGDYAFTSCSRLTNVTIPNGVTSIGQDAFYSCSGLTSVTIPNSVTSFGDRVFGDCSNLTSVTIPNRITSISASAFTGCSNLTSVTIPNSVTSIGAGAFTSCTSLTSVTIPDSVTSIDRRAFLSCTKLTDIYFGGTETQWNAISIGTGAIPDTVTVHYNSRTRSVVSNAGTAGYTDVPAGAAYAEAVNYCKVNNLMTGTSATEFTPNGTLTRAMMVTVLHRLAGKPAASSTASFADVPAGKWYTDAISWANSKGIVLGYNATTFGVNDPVTHEQVALIFQRYSGDPTVQTEGADSPKTPATRAEIAVTLMNFARSRKPGALSVLSAIDVMCAPSGIAVDQNGVLLVTDLYNKQVWKVLNRAGTAYAGGATVPDLYGQPLGGYNDGNLTGSYFKEPWAVAPFLDGWAVSDTANNAVRLITGGGIQTLNTASKEKLTVTNLGVAFNRPTGLAADEDGNLYVADTGSGTVRRVSPQGGVSTVAKGLSDPTGLCWKDGALYIAETGRNRILQLKDGKITVLAGSGSDGSAGGRAAQASFSAPQGVAVGEDGSVYVADTGNGAVRMIKSGTVSTLAVRDPAQLSGDMISPVGLLLQGGSLYVCDPFVRKIFVLAVA